MMNEIKRLQQLAGIITEIKVNNPSNIDYIMGDYEGTPYKFEGEDLIFFLEKALHLSNSLEDFIKKFTYGVTDETDSLSKPDIEKIKRWYSQNNQKDVYEIKVNTPTLKKFNGYMHVLDFFGGELPQRYEEAKSQALKSGYELTIQEYTQADQNSTFSEIKVNNPNTKGLSMEDFYDLRDGVEVEFENYRENIQDNENEDFNEYLEKVENANTIQELDDALLWLYAGDLAQVEETKGNILKGLQEDVSKFKIGQTSHSDGHKSTVTDVDTTTQSVTWDIKKEISDKEIWDDLTKLLNKFEAIHLKDFHSRPKLNSLIRDLKTLRNKFSRTIVKEDLYKLKENLVGILNEIKVNNPQRITIGNIEDDELGNPINWIKVKLVLKYLLPIFPNREQEIKDWVEEWNDYGVEEEELETTTSELKKHFLEQNG